MIRPSSFILVSLLVTGPVRAESTAGAGVTPSTSPSAAAPAGAATADPQPAPVGSLTPAERSALARTEYHKGNAAFGEGRFTAARSHFLRALDAEESFDVLCNLGRTDAELKDDVSAAEHLRRGLRIYPADPELAAARQRFTALLAEVEARLTDMQKEIVDVRVAHADAAAAAARATEAEPAEPKRAEGAPGGDVAAERESGGSARLPVSLAVGGAGVVLVGVGVGFLVDSSSAAGAADERLAEQEPGTSCIAAPAPPVCADIQRMNAQADSSLVTGAVLAGVGGGVVLGGLLTYLLWPEPSDATAAFVRPAMHASPARGDFAIGLRGRF